jgi:uncharacterized protein (TIRG00374 family)
MSFSIDFPRRVKLAVKLLISAIFLYIVFIRIDWNEFITHVDGISYWVLILVIVLSFFDRCLMGFKWKILLSANHLNVTLKRVVSIYLESNFLGSFTPGNLGGDAYRIIALRDHGQSSTVLSTVIIERIIGLLSLIIYILITLPFSLVYFGGDGRLSAYVSIFIGIIFIVCLFVILHPFSFSIIEKLFNKQHSSLAKKLFNFVVVFRNQFFHGTSMLIFIFLTLFETGYYFFLNYLASLAAGVHISFFYMLVMMPLVHFILRIPITIQGLGLQEGLLVFALSFAGVTAAEGVFISIIWRVVDLFSAYLPGWVLFSFRKR